MENVIFKTLIHSLWQGLVLAVITALILVFSTKSTAKLRYNLLIFCLIAFTISIGSTFIYECSLTEATAGNVLGKELMFQNQVVGSPDSVISSRIITTEGWIGKAVAYFNTHSGIIVLVWFLVICAKSVQLFAGLYHIRRIRNTKITTAGQFWKSRVAELSAQFGIAATVGIVQSGIAKVPMVIGHFKPLILIPVGLINGLSVAEVEAIICHELAHIKRRDYLVNILQSFMEVVFFFNPAVLWISKLIREERESCCDELTIVHTHNKAVYIRALISFQEFQSDKPQYAMAISGHEDQLVQRVRRMVVNQNPALNRLEKAILAVGLIAVITLTAAFSGGEVQGIVDHKIARYHNLKQDIKKGAFSQDVNNGDVLKDTALSNVVEKRQFSESSLNHSVAAERPTLETLNAGEQSRFNANQQYHAIDEVQQVNTPADLRNMEDKHSMKIGANANVKPDLNEDTKAEGAIIKKGTSTKVTVKTGITADYLEKGEFTEEHTQQIIDDLIKDGLIQKTANFSFKIDRDNLIVDGVKLSESWYRKYTKKYLKRPDWILVYNYDSNTEHL